MQRITHPSAVLAEPVLVEAGNVGYFDDQTPGVETVFTARWLNRVQNELCNVIIDIGGLTLNGASDTQLRDTLAHTIGRPLDTALPSSNTICDKSIAVSRTSQIDSGVTYANILASEDSRIWGLTGVPGADTYDAVIAACRSCQIGGTTIGRMCLAVASDHLIVDGTCNAAIASSAAAAAYVRGSESVVIACQECSTVVGSANQFVAGSMYSEVDGAMASIMSSSYCFSTGAGSIVVASHNAELNDDCTIGGGFNADAHIAKSAANQKLTWKIKSDGGVIYATNTTVQGIDYAEMFPNADAAIIEAGCLVARVGRRVRAAVPGDRILGVVSTHPSVLGGSAELGWDGQYEKNIFGAIVTDDDGKGHLIMRRSVDYDPAKDAEYQSRAKRPEEWTCVGLLGQLHVRIDDTVTSETLFLEPGTDGRGTATDTETRCEVMEITTAYTKKRGYGVALCLVR